MGNKQGNKKDDGFKELYEYVKSEIMGYDENQSLDRYMILRLRGMQKGQYMANKYMENVANYPFDIILLTFKYVKPKLDYMLKTKDFTDEHHKFNYIMKIVENNLNLVYNKAKKVREEKLRLEQVEVDDLPNYNNKYTGMQPKEVDKDLESFW